MIAVALPGIMVEFGSDPAATGWLVTAYLIVMASLQPVTGKLGDRLGRRRLILGGLICFGLASLGAALAPSLLLLILLRVAQAISGAVVLPNGDALLREIVPAERRAARYGLIGSAVGLAAAVGPPLGGLLVTTLSWRAMFAVNLALILPALLLGWRHLPAWSGRATGRAFDWLGALLLSTILVSLAGLLSRGGAVASPAVLLVAAGLLAALLVVFVRRELGHPEPVLQPRFFRRPAFAAAAGAVTLSNLSMYSTLLTIPLLWVHTGRPTVEIGFVLGVMAITMVVIAPFGGRLADRFGRRWPTVGGLAALTVGTGLVALAGSGSPALTVAGLAILGLGLGFANPGIQVSAIEAVERADAGAAAGAYSTCRYLGGIVGSALLAGLVSSAPSDAGFNAMFGTITTAALLACLLAVCLPHRST
jgi:DHA2 family methylenomycin A resistance protein-like MFS transporter